MSSTRTVSTISVNNVAYLASINALTPPKTSGFRTLSVSSFLSSSSSPGDDSIEIPDSVNSVAALQFCGFTPTVAEEIYQRYTTSTVGGELLPFATGYISGKAYQQNAILVTDDWDGALTFMGMRMEKRRALLKAEHTPFRMLGTAETWAQEIVQNAYEWLLELDGIITHGQKRNANSGVRPYSPGLSVTPSPAIRPSSSRPSSSGTGQKPQPIIETTVKLPDSLDAHTMIYKGGLTTRLEKVWPDTNSNQLEFAFLYSKAPTDFHPTSPYLLYFTKSKQCAQDYANFAADTNSPIPTAILQVAVPQDIISEATPIFGTDFQQLVFESRTPNPRGKISAHLQHYADAPLLVAPVCGVSNEVLSRQAQDYTGVTQLQLSDGSRPSQYAFQGNAMADKLNNNCLGKVWLEELASRDMGRWRKE